MKRKSVFLLLGVLFGLCEIFGFTAFPIEQVFASSNMSSVWDGTQSPEVSDSDWWKGTDNTYHINSAKGLAYFSAFVNGRDGQGNFSSTGTTIMLETDIDLAGNAWVPIGYSSDQNKYFNGTFDGQGHTIFNGVVDDSYNNCGFFGYLGANAKIENLNLRNITISPTQSMNVGVLAGSLVGATDTVAISNVSVKGSINLSSPNASLMSVGGLVGNIENVKIENCMTDVKIDAQSNSYGPESRMGGLLGRAYNTTLTFCYSESDIICSGGNMAYLGGLVGASYNGLVLENSYNAGDLSANCAVQLGGIIGRTDNGKTTIRNIYSSGNITYVSASSTYVGGVIGFNNVANSSREGCEISDAFVVSVMQKTGSENASINVSPFYNVGKQATLNSAYYENSLVDAQGRPFNVDGGVEDLTSLTKTRDFYRNTAFFTTDWDFSDDNSQGWVMQNDSFPTFKLKAGHGIANNDEEGYLRGEGTAQSPYLVETARDLGLVSQMYATGSGNEGKYFSLQSDIDLTGKTWVPIGLYCFSGVFDGNGHKISNIMESYQEQFNYLGLFGKTSDAVIKNLFVENFVFKKTNNQVCGNIVASIEANTYIVNCVDLNTENNSVGEIANNSLFVAYGKNNLQNGRIDETTLKLGSFSYTKLYDVTISGEGGNFFNKNVVKGGEIQRNASKTGLSAKNMYLGDFHIILDREGKSFYPTTLRKAPMDETLGQTFPALSTKIGQKDVLIRLGYKLTGLSYISDEGNVYNVETGTLTTFDSAKAVQGLKSIWEESSETVSVIYNKYELDKLGAKADESADYIGKTLRDGNRGTISDKNGEVTFKLNDNLIQTEYTFVYDSFVDQASSFFTDKPSYLADGNSIKALRGEYFDVEGFYENYSDGDFIGDSFKVNTARFANDELTKTLYVKWKGKDQDRYTAKLKITGAEDFAVKDAVKNAQIIKNSETGKEANEITGSQTEQVYSFSYDTVLSDRADNYFKFNVKLNAGYMLNGSDITLEYDNAEESDLFDDNFGGFSWQKMTTLDTFNDFSFINMRDNITIKIGLMKETYIDNLKVSKEVFYGLGPNEKFVVTKKDNDYSSNLEIKIDGLNDGNYQDILSYIGETTAGGTKLKETLADARDTYIAFDLINDKILFATKAYDSIDLPFDFNSENKIYLRFDKTKEYYLQQSTESGQVSLTLFNTTKTKQEVKTSTFAENVAELKGNEEINWNMTFQSHTDFLWIFSANNTQEQELFTLAGAGYDDSNLNPTTKTWKREILKTFQDENKLETKFIFTMQDALRTDMKLTKTLSAVGSYSKASLGFNLVYDGEDVQMTDFPTVLIQNSDISVAVNSEIEFYVVNSDRFRFFAEKNGQDEVALFSGEGNTYNIKIEVSGANQEGAGDYEGAFNGNNKTYFSRDDKDPTIEKIAKGSTAPYGNGEKLEHSAYKITLPFYGTEAQDNQGKAFLAGRYIITLVCTDVLYSIEYDTKYLDFENVSTNGNIDGEKIKTAEFVSQNDTDISTTVTKDGVNVSSFKYDEEISFSTLLGDNHGFKFAGWLDICDNKKDYSDSESRVVLFSEIFKTQNDIDDDRKLTAYAVYVKKQAHIGLGDTVMLDDDAQSLNSLGISLSMDQGVNNIFTYKYGTDADPGSISITMNGENSSGYTFAGFNLLDENGSTLQIFNSGLENGFEKESMTNAMSINLSWLSTALENGALLGEDYDGIYFIQPVIDRKSLTLSFHSGTGTNTGYGDGKDEHVFDNDPHTPVDTTSTVYRKTLKFGDVVDFSELIPDEQSKTLSELFFYREGYKSGRWTVDQLSSDIYRLAITSELFSNESETIAYDVYRLWEARSFLVTFNANRGNFGNALTTTIQTTVVYDSTYSQGIGLNGALPQPVRDGYTFVGWFTQIDESGQLIEGNTIVKITDDQVLYAHWSENTYLVKIVFNGANQVPGQSSGITEAQYSIKYNQTFDNLSGAGINGIDSFTQENVLRKGFTFAGIYARNGQETLQINSQTVFSLRELWMETLPEQNNVALTLYVGWTFNLEDFYLSLIDNTLPNKVYNMGAQIVYLSEYFVETNVLNAELFEISGEENTFSIDINPLTNLKFSKTLTTNSDAVLQEDSWAFSVYTVGTYNVNLEITLSDKIEDDLIFGNWQDVVIRNELYVYVEPAYVNISEEVNELLYLNNLKRFVGPFLSKAENARLQDCATLSLAVGVLKEIFASDSGLVEIKEEKEVYEFFMTKYYLLIQSGSDYTLDKFYRSWTYEEYLAYKQENSKTVETILRNTFMFDFYDFKYERNIIVIEGYEAFFKTIISQNETVVDCTQLQVDTIELFSNEALKANRTAQLRVYVSTVGLDISMSNFSNIQKEQERYYIVAGTGFIMPQVVVLENISKKTGIYYSQNYTDGRDVEFVGEGERITLDQQDYYCVSNSNTYVYATLKTSNVGQANKDTTFTYFDKENYLYFSELVAQTRVGDQYQISTHNFKFLLSENFEFKIMSTAGVVDVSITAKYLTLENNQTVSYVTLPESLHKSILAITEVQYEYEGQTETITDIVDGANFNSDGVEIFQVEANHANNVEIILGSFVKSVKIASATRTVGEFASFFKWTRTSVYSVDGTMASSLDMQINSDGKGKFSASSEIEGNVEDSVDSNGMIIKNYEAVYTDLVLVTYDNNFPETYQSDQTSSTMIKLGEEVTGSILPYERGFGSAATLKIVDDSGKEVGDYTQLNNTLVGEKMVFGGWNNTTDSAGNQYRFAPITLTAKWSIPETWESSPLLEDEKWEVYSYQSLNYAEVVNLSGTNENIFDYSYQWEITYKDQTKATATGPDLALRENGSYNASGTYVLTVIGKVKDEFIKKGSLVDGSKTEISCSVEFSVEFMRNRLMGVTLPSSPSATYDGNDHKLDDSFVVEVQYQEFDNDIGNYVQSETHQQRYVSSGLIYFLINGMQYDENGLDPAVKNVGKYDITVVLLSSLFELGDINEDQLKFSFQILPMEVDLSENKFSNSLTDGKAFNMSDPDLSREVTIGSERVILLLERDRPVDKFNGEDVGQYDMFLTGIEAQSSKDNFRFVFTKDGVKHVLFENGDISEKFPIGKFIVEASGTLRISLTSEDVKNGEVQSVYNGKEFSLSIRENTLQILNDDSVDKTLSISLYDTKSGQDISLSSVAWQILSQKMSSIISTFLADITYVSVKDAGVYNFQFSVSDTAFANYFNAVESTNDVVFHIVPQEIDVEKLSFDKVFDGLEYAYFSVDGRKLDSPEGFYLKAKYQTVHVDEHIFVEISKEATLSSGVSTNNYTLTQSYAFAKITPASATLTLSRSGVGILKYGQVNVENLSSLVTIQSLKVDGKEMKQLLEPNTYEISYSLNDSSKSNARGYLYKGEYKVSEDGDIVVEYSFQDFVITNLEGFTINIETLEITHEIEKGQFSITTASTPQESYTEILLLEQTSDEVILTYSVKGLQQPLSAGYYTLELKHENESLVVINGSVIINIDPKNQGFYVAEVSDALVIKLSQEDIEKLTKIYNGKTSNLTTNPSGNSFTISDNENSITVNFTGKVEGKNEDISFTFTKLEVFFLKDGEKVTEFRNVGTYLLSVEAETESYQNIVLSENIYFQITPLTIDVEALSKKGLFDKDFDGDAKAPVVDSFDKKVEGDDVSISGLYRNAGAEEGKELSLFIEGSSSGNYALSNETTKGAIRKAEVTIKLLKTQNESDKYEYTYGEVTYIDNVLGGLTFEAYLGETKLQMAPFSVTTTLQSQANVSDKGFLKVISQDSGYGSYKIKWTATSTSSNYKVSKEFTAEIIILPKEIENYTFSQREKIYIESGSTAWNSLKHDDYFTVKLDSSLTPLFEEIEIGVKFEGLAAIKAVGSYKINGTDFICKNENYTIKSLTDKIDMLVITIPAQRLFALIDDGTTTINVEYDGLAYDAIKLMLENGVWTLVLYNTQLSSVLKPVAKLSFYTLVGTEYQKYDGVVENLNTTLHLSKTVQNVTSDAVQVTASDTTADSHIVKIGKNNSLYAFDLNITSRKLYFSTDTIQKMFNNQEANYQIDVQTELYNGVKILENTIEGDDIILNLTFKKAGQTAKYVERNLDIEAFLSGSDAENYVISRNEQGLLTWSGIVVHGQIDYAEITVIFDNPNFVYGQLSEGDTSTLSTLAQIDFGIEDFDLEEYKKTRSFEFSALVHADDVKLSSSKHIAVGTYQVDFRLEPENCDFILRYYVINGDDAVASSSNAKVEVTPFNLEVVRKNDGQSLQQIFSRNYDGTKIAKIKGDDGALLFDLKGLYKEDKVDVKNAEFSAERGQGLIVKFVLDGRDCENYTISDYTNGTINSVEIKIEYDCEVDVQDSISGKLLEALAYPFISPAYLTSNAYSVESQNLQSFPSTVTGAKGKTFTCWTLKLTGLDSEKVETLNRLQKRIGFEMTANGTDYDIVVANDSKTVSLLSELLKDDTFGLFYQKSPTITLHAHWKANMYSLTVQVADKNGEIRSLGEVISDNFEGKVTSSQTFDGDKAFVHGTKIVLRAKANEHVSYYGFYNSGTLITEDDTFSIGEENGMKVLTIKAITSNLTIVVRFAVQNVKFVFDLSDIEGDVNIENSSYTNFEKDVTGNFVWQTDYYAIQSWYLSNLPLPQLVGHELTSYVIGEDRVEKADFSSTNFEKYLTGLNDIEIIIKPNFERIIVEVTLNFGYGGQTQTIYVLYGEAYKTGDGWQETLSGRDGYEFAGWFNDNDVRIYGETLVTTANAHRLIARWNPLKYSIKLHLSHARLISDNVTFVAQDEGIQLATGVEYTGIVTFTLKVDEGWEFDSSWENSLLSVVVEGDEATVTFVMPNKDVEIFALVHAKQNTVTFGGEHIESVQVFDVTSGERENVETNLLGTTYSFVIETGKKIEIVLSAEAGYLISQNIVFDNNSGITCSSRYENNTLIVSIEGIVRDTVISLTAEEGDNELAITFDNPDSVETVVVGGRAYSAENLPTFNVKTSETLVFTIRFAHGYTYSEHTISDAFSETLARVDVKGMPDGTYEFTVSGMKSNAQIEIKEKYVQFHVIFEAVSYDEHNQLLQNFEGNKVYIEKDGDKVSDITVDYNTVLSLSLENVASYAFAGWSLDGESVLNEAELTQEGLVFAEGKWSYKVSDSKTIYAIFSESDYEITLSTYDYISLGANQDKEEFREVSGQYFEVSQSGEKTPVTNFDLYYGQSKTILFEVPDGYQFGGFGYESLEGFKFLQEENRKVEEIFVTISTLDFGTAMVNKIYMVIVSLETQISIQTQLDFDGTFEEDTNVGSLALVDENGEGVDETGYLKDSRLHVSDQINSRKFKVTTYTNEFVYLKVLKPRAGYTFEKLITNTPSIIIDKYFENEEYFIFKLDNIVGDMPEIEITALYSPQLNLINLAFYHRDMQVKGGIFDIICEQTNKLWTSQNGGNYFTVTAFTDIRFTVKAYIRAGFVGSLQSLEGDIIVPGTETYTPLSIEQTGFSGVITFDVFGFANLNEIKIVLQEVKYTVLLKDGEQTLAKIKNVGFDTDLQNHISQTNSDNIESELGYINGILNARRNKKLHYFEGYFTMQNGAGIQYIDSEGNARVLWQENGYEFNSLTGLYELGQNAVMNENGQIEISLYLYMSYLKTRLNFVLTPALTTTYTAQDFVSGVDDSNSWFYISSPNYIEIAYNTDIYITAPEIANYKFYKFIVSQKTFDGTWLTDVVSYQSRLPWSTNEIDNIVECRVEIVYFALVNVKIVGGEGLFKIEQDAGDAQATQLLSENYIDTSKPFKISVGDVEGLGYNFLRWQYSGQVSTDREITIASTRSLTITMFLEGKQVILDFSDYKVSRGYIARLSVLTMTGTTNNISMGHLESGVFSKDLEKVPLKVGDLVTFFVAMDSQTSVTWNRDDILFDRFANNYTYFNFKILGEFADKTNNTIKIIPTFSEALRTIYISKAFASDELLVDALDMNDASFAGTVYYQGRATNFISVEKGSNIEIDVFVQKNYEIKKILLHGSTGSFEGLAELYSDGRIVLTETFLSENNISGTINLQISFARLMWDKHVLEVSELSGSGTERNPYRISTTEELVLMERLANSGERNSLGRFYRDCSYLVKGVIDLDGKFWTPIGTSENPFNGSFDFSGATIKNINHAKIYEETYYGGLFGVLGSNAKIVSVKNSIWWIILIVAVVLFLIILLVALLYSNKKNKRQNEELSKR